MGTNFYWIGHRGDSNIRHHIGKRSAAGSYCWDCGTTLCLEGSQGVHRTRSERSGGEMPWADECPVCGNEKGKDPGTAFVELGFKRAKEIPRRGVGSCSSFSWTLMSHKWRITDLALVDGDPVCVVNEYGDEFTAKQFLYEELATVAIESQCPYEFS